MNIIRTVIPYAAALGIASLALAIQWFFLRQAQIPALGVLYPAAFFTAFYFGFRPALVEILFSSAFAYFIFYEPQFVLSLRSNEDNVRLLVFVSTTIFVAWFVARGRRAEKTLHGQEQSLQAIFEHAHLGFSLVSLDWRFIEVNPAMARFLGYSREELRGLGARDISHPEDRDGTAQRLQRLRDGMSGPNFEIEKRYLRPDGSTIWGRSVVSLVRDPAGKPLHFVAVTEDVTDQIKARQIERQLTHTLENLSEGFFSLDRELRYTYANHEMRKLAGVQGLEEIVGLTCRDIFTSPDRERFIARYEKVIATGQAQRFEDEFLGRFMQVNAYPTEEGGVAVLYRDVTDAREASERVALAENRMVEFFRQVPAAVAILRGPDHVFEFVNPEYQKLTGVDSTTIGRSVAEVFPYLPDSLSALLRKVYDEGERFVGYETPLTMDWGRGPAEQKYLNFIYEPLRGPGGAVEGIMVFAQEVTDQVMIRRAAEAGEAQIRAYAEVMPQMAFIAAPDGEILYFNQRFYNYIGVPPEQQVGWRWQDNPVHHPDDLPHTVATWQRSLLTGEPYEVEYRLRRHDGEYRWHLGRALPVRDESGRITRWYGTNTDIHDHKMHQESLLSTLRARDEFLSVASHELRTPLTSLKLQAQAREIQLNRHGIDFFHPDRLRKMVTDDNRQIDRLARLVDDMLDVSRIATGRMEMDFQSSGLASLVQESVDRLQPLFRTEGVELNLELKGDPLVRMDAGRLEQALTNLLTNALKYGQGKPVRVEVLRERDHALLRVIDRGRGISPESQDRIFQRFERAVSANEVSGLGLGLFITKEIVSAHQGEIRLRSEVGAGSTFEIRLPLAPEASESERQVLEASPRRDN